MNTRTSLIAIGATLALIAPAAANARAIVSQSGDMYFTYFTSEHGSHALVNATNFVSENGHAVTSGKKQSHHTIGKTSTTGRKSVSRHSVIYIYQAGPAAGATTYVDPNECADTGGNCTDEQLCTSWGENCDIVNAVPQEASPASDTTN